MNPRSRKKWAISFLFLLTLGFSLLHPDQPRRRRLFTSANTLFELRLVDQQEGVWELFDIDLEKGRYFIYDEVKQYWRDKLKRKADDPLMHSVPGEFGSQTALISDDGVVVALVDDFSENLEAGLPVMRIFHNGKIMKNIFLRELLRDPGDISRSASHSFWFCPNSELRIDNGRIRLVTFELNQISINIRSGRVEIEPLSIVHPDSILAFGKISRLSANRYQIEVTRLVRGRIPPHGMVEFTAADQEWLGNHDHGTVLITDGRYDPRLGDFCREMILNQANFPAEAKKRN